MLSIQELIQFAESQYEYADLSGDCEMHGEQSLVYIKGEPICPQCLTEFLYRLFRAISDEFALPLDD